MENAASEEKVISLERVQGKKFRLRIKLEKRSIECFDGLVNVKVLPNAEFVTALARGENDNTEIVLRGKKEDLLAHINSLGNHCINIIELAEL
jgi:hypothetical protein